MQATIASAGPGIVSRATALFHQALLPDLPAAVRGLVALDMALLTGFLLQVTDVLPPSSVWIQFPLVAMGIYLTVQIIKYWTENETRWREFIEAQDLRHRDTQMALLTALQASHKEMMMAVSEAQRSAYEEALERFLGAFMQSTSKGGR